MLDFVKKLFLRLPPNLSGLCEALEDFLDCRGYRLRTQVGPESFILRSPKVTDIFQGGTRRRFSNALRWYTVLSLQTAELVRQAIDEKRPPERPTTDNPSPNLESSPQSIPGDPSPPAVPHVPRSTSHQVTSDNDTPPTRPESTESTEGQVILAKLIRPTLYLRRRCPICFGGLGGHTPGSE